MKKWFEKWNMKLRQWMYGRYGSDELNHFILILSIVFLILAWIPYLKILWLFSFGLLIWSYYRCFSKNIYKRRQENDRFLKIKVAIKKPFLLQKNKWRDRKTHRYFQCKSCKAVLRVPKGKGEIDITCPKCKQIITKKT